MASPKLQKTKTPGIYQRGSRYVGVYRDGSGHQRKVFGRTIKEAIAKRDARRVDTRRGEDRELSRVTLAAYAAEWIETYTGRTNRGLGEGTRADYRGALERDILPLLGRLRLVDIGPRDIKRLGAILAERGLKPASISKTVAPLKALLATALEEQLIRSNPAAGVRIAVPTDDVGEPEQVKALTEPELERLLTAFPEEWRLFFRFLFETGLRIGEAIEVRYRDIEGVTLRVDRRFYRGRVGLPKGRKRRRIGLTPEMATALWEQRKTTRAKDDDLVFAAPRGGRIDPSNVMTRVLKPAAVQAGLGEWARTPKGALVASTWVGFHTMRHTCATALFRRGWNAVQVQKFLGHSDAGFTLRTYVHLLDEDIPQPDFGVGNSRATEANQTGRNAAVAKPARFSPRAGESSDVPNQPEVLAAHS